MPFVVYLRAHPGGAGRAFFYTSDVSLHRMRPAFLTYRHACGNEPRNLLFVSGIEEVRGRGLLADTSEAYPSTCCWVSA